jgi:superfamily II DNA or RNA helicase
MLELRPLQERSLDLLREKFREGHRSVLLYGPTGFGKTELAIALMNAAKDKGSRAAMVLDRIMLCEQTSQRLQRYNIDHGVLQSGHWRFRPHEQIQVCSAQTLEKRGSFPGLSILLVDECHCQRKQTTEFIKNNNNMRVVGLSASPFTRGLGKTYDAVVSATTTKELVDQGWLAGLRVFIAKQIDMTGAKKVAGEWSDKETTERGIKITGDIVAEWIKKTHEIFGEPKKTIVFCSGVAHGEDLSKRFAEAGYNFVSISYKDDDDFKQEAIAEFSKPDSSIHGLIATDILTKGFDCADVMIGISARPFSKSFSSHVQQMGRLMRSYPGKQHGVWLCHSGNYLRFRDQWDDLYANGVSDLDDGAEKPKPEPSDEEKERAKCPACGALWPGRQDICANCGHVRQRKNQVAEEAGELSEITTGASKEKYTGPQKEQWYRELLGYAREKGWKDGWAWHKYQEKFKIKPVWAKVSAAPSAEIRNWVISQNIRKAHSRRS